MSLISFCFSMGSDFYILSRQWNAETGERGSPWIIQTHDGSVTSLTVTAQNNKSSEFETRLFSCSTDKTVLVWDIVHAKPAASGKFYGKNSIRFITPDTQDGRIVTADDRKVIFRDALTGKEAPDETFAIANVTCLALTEDIIYTTSGSSDKKEILLWNRWGDVRSSPSRSHVS